MYVKKAILGTLTGVSLFSVSCKQNPDQMEAATNWDENNSFYTESTLPYQTADFEKIKNKDFKPAILEGMRRQVEAIDKITANTEAPTFENTLVELEKSSALLDRVSAVFHILVGAHTNDEIKAINQELSPKFAAHRDGIYLNDALFQKVKQLHDQQASLGLTNEQTRLLEVYYQEFVRSGANLKSEQKETLKAINQELATLTTTFGDQLLAATKAGSVVFTQDELDGLSSSEMEAFKQADGTYAIPLNNTTQQPIAATLNKKESRQKLFEAGWSRTEQGDDNDTRATLLAIAKKRAEKAELLGYKNYAEWSLQGSMANKPEQAKKLMDQLSPYAVGAATQEAKEIQDLINQEADPFTLTAADWDYYAEKIREQKYALNLNDVKPYFEMNAVLEKGVFYMAQKLYGITFEERKDIPVWQEDVRVFEIFNEDKSPIGLFYVDFYARESKRGGAWMGNLVTQSKLLNQAPVVYNVCNYQKPAAGQPTLLSPDEVITMFHEFGHGLHGFFSDVTYPTLAGTSVSRDFVELPSQFHEHFAFLPEVLTNYAKHYETGEVIPASLIEKMKAAQNFNIGYGLTEILSASLLDMEWHTISSTTAIKDVATFEKEALAKYGIDLATVPPRYRSSFFNHVFGGGYAAGYYSYTWAETLDNDAFQWLIENGGMTRENGEIFRAKILSKGNTKPSDEMYREFRGKDATIDAYLKMKGFDQQNTFKKDNKLDAKI
ncbi:M3 family metallopeptidase [Myroides sp. DF42-4-2]|uniref:M3 family metallopeptidase n=1 Tax=unclassified Myroides TaxID=2642485 RepID=UPI0025773737|nr:M3 family metallopeptidase [Myroides sp. DF42-4-2]MDM1407626.1 M3 family metallopeptidase [Myroides sp. DF42-4-2]